MRAYDTLNSTYLVDLDQMRYKRLPGARTQPVWSHRLTYDEWHPLLRAPEMMPNGNLHIMRADSVEGIFTTPVVREYEVLDSDGTFTEDDQGNWHPVSEPPS